MDRHACGPLPSATVKLTSLVALPLLLLSPALIACSGEDTAERAAEEAIEQELGGDVDVELGDEDGEFSVDTGDGSFSAGDELPEGFPDSVPLIEGSIVFALANSEVAGAESFAVNKETALSVDEASAEITSQLEGAGFTSELALGAGGGTFVNDEFEVFVLVVAEGDGSIVQYAVTAA